ncbi:MAG: SoxR reducing system RseC family protein [Zoogloeaceae bacterium]|nr:SoxR reducing system RseC family protein [Zoogloeaceae bacterium]
MSETKATVSALDGEYALVRTGDGGCGRCNEPGGCGGVNVTQMFCSQPREWRVLNPRGAKVGEEVRVAIADGALTATALTLYVLPLALLFVGAILGAVLFSELGGILGALSGLILAWRWVVHQQKKRHCDSRFHPHIV